LIAALLLCLAGQLHSGDTLEAVRFEGNRGLSRALLAGAITARARKPCSEVQLNRDASTLELLYQSRGYNSVQVDRIVVRGKRLPVVVFRIEEGPRTRVGTVVLSGNEKFGTGRLLKEVQLRPGSFLVQSVVDQSGQALRAFYLNSGYPFAEVTAEASRKDSLATVWFNIHEGPLCSVGEVRVTGNLQVRTRTILRTAEVRPGERFSQKRLYEAQRRLYATRLFSRVMFYVLKDSARAAGDESAGSVAVKFAVVEQACRGMAFGVGGEMPPYRLLFSAEWEHDNVFNRGQNLSVGGEYSPTFSRDYRLGVDGTYRVPYFLLTRVDFQTRPYLSYERVDSNLQREYGIETGMSRSFTPQFTAGLSNRLRLVSDTASGITNSLGLTGQYDTRNDILEPTRGLSVQGVAEAAGWALGGDNDLLRLTADCRWFKRLGGRPQAGPWLVLAARAMAGRVWPYGRSEAVPYYEAFTLGGRSTLRGYEERSLGPDSSEVGEYRYGPAVVNANVELRTPYILRWVGFVAFVDVGAVGRDLRLFGYEYSAGVGVRVNTPIGPVRLDWGKRLKNPPAGDKGRFYLGLLHAF
jgi:outer membrane protein assembly complex protein YaeT